MSELGRWQDWRQMPVKIQRGTVYRYGGNQRYKAEASLLLHERHGRWLERGETVEYVNGDRMDVRTENVRLIPRRGSPFEAGRSQPDDFWKRVDKTDTCWLWTGPTQPHNGYGRLGYRGRSVFAHRLAYELLVGPIPDGLTLDHLCRVRTCVNPLHLEPVTQRENTLRGDTIAAANARKTSCKRGHPFSPENTHIYCHRGTVRRSCKECNRQRNRRKNQQEAS